MSSPDHANDQVIALQAHIAEHAAAAGRRDAELAARDTELKRAQAALLLAQAQILELGDLLAARDTALKNAEAGAPDLQRILDTELARANDLRQQLRASHDALAAEQLRQAAAAERAVLAERLAREQLAHAAREADAGRATLDAVSQDLAGHRQHVANLDAVIADLRAQLAAEKTRADQNARRATAEETSRVATEARLRKLESSWIWRATKPLHD